MKTLEYLTGKEGIILLGFVVLIVLIIKKWKQKRYFKTMDKRINNKKKN